jgi:hypothetical protein
MVKALKLQARRRETTRRDAADSDRSFPTPPASSSGGANGDRWIVTYHCAHTHVDFLPAGRPGISALPVDR